MGWVEIYQSGRGNDVRKAANIKMRRNCKIILGVIGISVLLIMILNDKFSKETKSLLINEVCSNNFSTGVKENHEGSDWIELYNAADKDIFLGDYYLSDDRDDYEKCKLPDIYLKAGGFYVFYATGLEEGDDSDLNFKINADGEVLYLSKEGQTIDHVEVPALKMNVTWSRINNNGEEWQTTEATIGKSNVDAEIVSDIHIEVPVFSRTGGFYNEPFALEIEGTGEIFYSLDGSDPDCNSIRYTGPIDITNVSGNPNLYSARTDMSTVSQFVPEELVDKILVVRAVCIDEDGNTSDIVTNSYLVEYQDEEAYQEMYTVSLVTDPGNLFDYEKGIYVLGEAYNTYMLEDGSMEDAIQIPANYRIKGKLSERAGNIEIWDENGNVIMNRQIGMRVHGSTTRGVLQKSFSIYSRELYDDKEVFDEGVFGQEDIIRKFFIYSDRDQSKLKHILNQELVSDRAVETQGFIRCNVFLDGEYWGVYSLAEVYDEYYFNNHYGIPLDNLEICESANPDELVEFINSGVDMSSDSAYEEISELMDMQSFIDYYGSMIYIDNYDWLPDNAICWRSISKGNNEKEDGKWRWAIWDTEGGEQSYDRNTFESGNIVCWKEDPIITGLMQNDNFRRDFVISFMDMVNYNFEEEYTSVVINEMLQEYQNSYELNRIRYFGNCDMQKYTGSIIEFFANRNEWVTTFLKEEFELQGDPVYIALLINKENAAEFSVNTLSLDRACSFWQGIYFNDYPVTLSVQNIDSNEQFMGWYEEDGTLISTEQKIEVNLGSETKLVYARFEE